MKKILTHLTGIVFLISILIAGGCKSATAEDDPGKPIYPEKVTIFLKAYEDGDDMKLKMYDSKNETPIVAEDHYADVGPDTKVVWKRANNSNIKSIRKVGPKVNNGPIFPGDATTFLFHKRLRITVPSDAPVPKEDAEDTSESYEIIFRDKDNNEWKTDPYLRIKGTN